MYKPDNQHGAIENLLALNNYFTNNPWPQPFNSTIHRLRVGDARDLSWVKDSSVHLIVTSPPYWNLKDYTENEAQLSAVESYEVFLQELDKVWKECARVLVPGGRICCVVGDVCVPRKKAGRHSVVPLHADIQVRIRKMGLDCLTPVIWLKIANGVTEARGNGAGFYGKPYQPNAIIMKRVGTHLGYKFKYRLDGLEAARLFQKTGCILCRSCQSARVKVRTGGTQRLQT